MHRLVGQVACGDDLFGYLGCWEHVLCRSVFVLFRLANSLFGDT